MARSEGKASRFLVWSYERGTLQYDILCALILAFIFGVPRSCFQRTPSPHGKSQASIEQAPPVTPQSGLPGQQK